MFKVLKGLRGDETFACWWGLLLTQCFWYWNIRDLGFLFFAIQIVTCCVQSPFINITDTTSISDYLHTIYACWLHWCLIIQMTTNWPLYSTSSRQSLRSICYYAVIMNSQTSRQSCLRLLTHSNICWAVSVPSLLTSCDCGCFVHVFHIVQNVKNK